MPKVSVLLPVYNTKEEYLRECIDSILAQTFTDFELLIINDCSTDENVEKVIKSYSDDRIKYYVNEHNLGISGTRNKLIHLASGEYLAVMDHDDISLPERFEKQVAFLDNNPEVGIVGTWYETFPKKKIKKKPEQSEEIENALLWSCPILHPSSMMRKSLNIRYEEKFTPAEDFALYCDLVDRTKFANLQEVLFKYRGHETNASKTQEHKMKRIAVFASYDKSGIIQDYVLLYLKELKLHVDKIIFIADNFATPEEQKKLVGFVDYQEFLPHGEYDFGSYKRGYIYAKNSGILKDADELIFCNDSCFAPIFPFSEMFGKMDKSECNFWGVLENFEIRHHLQSYFLVFRKEVFKSEAFNRFVNDITTQETAKNVILSYEIPLTSFLEENGFKSSSYINDRDKKNLTTHPVSLLKKRFPFIKKKVFEHPRYNKESLPTLLKIIQKDAPLVHSCILSKYKSKTNLSLFFRFVLKRIKTFFFQKRERTNTIVIKICKIPVWFYGSDKLKKMSQIKKAEQNVNQGVKKCL